jgi:predicted secreted protein
MLKPKTYLFLSMLLLITMFSQDNALAGQVLDESSNGDVVVVIVGQSLELSLESNPSTGYLWQYFPEFAGGGVLEETGHEYRGESNLIGASGREYWSFKVIGTGNAAISLGYMRPWESRLPEKTFTVDIKVTPQVAVLLNGKTLDFDVPPVIREDRTLVPLRVLSEALGAEVEWFPVTRQVTVQKEGITIEMMDGSSEVYCSGLQDGCTASMDVPAEIMAGRFFVPLRFLSETLGCRVEWDGVTRTVSIIG